MVYVRKTAGGWKRIIDLAPVSFTAPTVDPPPADPPPGVPYSMPTKRPYNVPTYAITPTPDGTGSAVHPSVIDFGATGWRGWRYWMAATPYYASVDQLENPCILVSADGFTWQVPAGLTNPVYPAPPPPRFNSDPELEYDPATDRLILLYRSQMADMTQQSFIAASSDGVTWPAAQELNWTRPYGGTGQILSPALVRRAAGDWWTFGIGRDDLHMFYHRASDPFGAWTGPFDLGVFALGGSYKPWHLDVIWDRGAFRAIVDMGPFYLGRLDGLRAGTIAADGSSMIWSGTNVIDRPTTGWETTQLYRTTMFPHENGTHYKVWYSAEGTASWRTGYTQVPKTEWPEIGDSITFPPALVDPATPKTPAQPWNPATFQQALIDLGAEGYWKLNETTGTVVTDYSGHGRHGVIAGITGTDYRMDGAAGLALLTINGSVQVPSSPVWTPSAGMTVFLAMRKAANQSGYKHVVTKRVGTEQVGEWTLDAFNGGVAGGYTSPTGSGNYSAADSGPASISLGPWHGVAMSKPATAAPSFYVDNTTPLQANASGTQAPGSSITPLAIGGGFIGQVAHVAVIMRDLTASEIGTLMTLARAEGLIA